MLSHACGNQIQVHLERLKEPLNLQDSQRPIAKPAKNEKIKHGLETGGVETFHSNIIFSPTTNLL
jgi:hypothetical protein